MNVLFQKLLESEVLSDEVKTELLESLNQMIAEVKQQTIEETATATKAEIYESWVEQRAALVESIDEKLNEMLSIEIEELKEDIERFRDLEAEYAEKIVEHKQELAQELQTDIQELVEALDTFMDNTIEREFIELKEDIDEARKLNFGRQIFEAFTSEYSNNFANFNDLQETVKRTEKKLTEATKALTAKEKEMHKLERKIKMEQVLAPLTGKRKEIMEAILQSVKTENLDEGYKTFIGKVMNESVTPATKTNSKLEKETSVLSENAKTKTPSVAVKTGDRNDANLFESATNQMSTEELENLRKLAGIV